MKLQPIRKNPVPDDLRDEARARKKRERFNARNKALEEEHIRQDNEYDLDDPREWWARNEESLNG